MTRALGIDIGASHIKIAEVEVASRNRELVGLYEIPRQEGIDPGTQLKDFLTTSGIKADRYIMGLGPAPVYVRRVSFPFGDQKRIKAAIQGEVEDSVPFSIENYVIDYRATSKAGRINNFVVGLCPSNWIDRMNAIAEIAGIMPFSFNLDAEAIGQMALHQQLPAAFEGALYAVVDLGFESTKVSLVRGYQPDPQDRKSKPPATPGEVVDFRTINKGSSELINWIKNERKVSFDEAVQWLVHRAVIKSESKALDEKAGISDGLSDEMKIALRPIVVELYQSFQAYRGRGGDMPSAIYITGALSDIKGLKEFFGEELRTPIYPWPIFLGFNGDKVPLTPEKERVFGAALSLAYRQVVANKPRGWLNFRRSPQAARKILSNLLANLSSPIYLPVFRGLGIFVAAFFVYFVATRIFLGTQLQDAKGELAAEVQSMNPDAGRLVSKASVGDATERASKAFESEKRKRAQTEKPKGRDPVEKARGEILVDVASSLPARAQIQSIKIEHAGQEIRITSKITSAEALNPQSLTQIRASVEAALTQRGYSKPSIAAGDGNNIELATAWKGKPL